MDTMKVAGTVVDLLVVVEMLDTLLKLRESFKHDGCRHDFETVFKEEFQESFATAGSVRNVLGTSAQHETVAAGGWSEQPQRHAGSQQGASQQWLERDMSTKPTGAPSSYPLPSTGGREEVSTELFLKNLPRLYPNAPPTARSVPQAKARSEPQAKARSVPAVHVHVKQPIGQPVSAAQGQDMYGEDIEEQPQLEQRQPLPRPPQLRHGTSHMHQEDHVTRVPGYTVDSQASQRQACHLPSSTSHDRMRPGGAVHPHGRGQISSSSEPPRPAVQQGSEREQFHDFAKVDYPSAGGGRPAPTGGLDIVNIVYPTVGSPEIRPVGHGESEYLNAEIIGQSVVPARRHSHEVPADKLPVPAPRRGPTALSTPSEPQAAFHSWSPQNARSRPHATNDYQSLDPVQQGRVQYAHLNRPVAGAHQTANPTERRPSAHVVPPDTNAYQPLVPTQQGPYAHLAPPFGRNPSMEQHQSPPHSMGSSGSAQHVAGWQYGSDQGRQLPETPHSSHDYYNVQVSNCATSKPVVPQHLAVDRYHNEDNSGGSTGQHSSGEYSKHGPSSDEDHSHMQVTRL